jgi:hypothetical protein
MNFAHYAQRQVSAGFKAMMRMLLDSCTNQAVAYGAMRPPIQRSRVSPAPFVTPKRMPPARTASIKPLRVLRVMEPGQQRTCVGRMVISGRMADVCAELERLAAREAAMS